MTPFEEAKQNYKCQIFTDYKQSRMQNVSHNDAVGRLAEGYGLTENEIEELIRLGHKMWVLERIKTAIKIHGISQNEILEVFNSNT